MGSSKSWTFGDKNVFWISCGILLLSLASIWLSLHNFPYLFLLPIFIGLCIFFIFKTEKFILLAGAIAPISIGLNDIGGGLGLSIPTEPLIILIFLAIVFKWMLGSSIPSIWFKHPLILVVSAYISWLFICSIFSSMPLVSFKFVLARSWYIAVYFFTLIILFKKFNNIHFFLKSLAIFTLILVLYTLWQHAAEGFVRSASYNIMWPFFPDHGMYAACIAFSVPTLLFYTFEGRKFHFSYAWLPVIGLFAIILLFGIVVSYTRATWLSLIAAFGLYAVLKMKIKFSWLLFVLFLGASYAVINQEQILYSLEANKQGSADELEGHVKSVSNITTDPSNLERINRWKCATRMAAERPIFGFGPGTYVFQYAPFQKSSELTLISTNAGDLGDAHSEFFSALSESGWMGLILWIALVLYTYATAFKLIYKAHSAETKITALIAILGLTTYHTHAFLNNYSQYDKIGIPLWGFMAILVSLDLYHNKSQSEIQKISA